MVGSGDEFSPSIKTFTLRERLNLAKSFERHEYLLINDTRSQPNSGCFVTTTNLIQQLREQGLRMAHSVTLLELKQLAGSLFEAAKPRVNSLREALDTFTELPEMRTMRQLLTAFDKIVVNVEGSIYGQETKGLVLMVLARYALDHGSRVVFVNGSYDLSGAVMRSWFEEVAKDLHLITAREEISFRKVLATRGGEHCLLFADAAFLTKTQGRWSKIGELGLPGPDSLLFLGIPKGNFVVVSGTSALKLAAEFEEARAALSDFTDTLRARGVDIVFWSADAADRKILRDVAILKRVSYLPYNTPVPFILKVFSGAACYVSGRWHGTILATIVGCKTLLFEANFYKTEALRVQLGWQDNLFKFTQIRELVPIIEAIVRTDTGINPINNLLNYLKVRAIKGQVKNLGNTIRKALVSSTRD